MLRETRTENGRVRGVVGTDARITVYKGIPFADTTAGENRWRPPQPAKDWEGVRDCSEFGPIPMQRIPGKDPEKFYSKEWHVDPEVPMGEDCLRVNIWTPAKTVDEKLPVMIWIFGGGLQEGYPHEMEFDGERIASRGVILCSIGYRVNVFGLLAHPEITAENPEAPANFCYQDQAAGIAWVKRNIVNFGGDPENITVFGQSAGGGSTLTQMLSPKTKGLFQKGIIESIGGMGFDYPSRPIPRMTRTLAEQEQAGVEVFKALGVNSLAEARALDAKTLSERFNELPLRLGSCIDGKFVVKPNDQAILDGDIHVDSFMIGNTKDEFLLEPDGDAKTMKMFAFGQVTDNGEEEEVDEVTKVDRWISKVFGPHADEYRELVKSLPGEYYQNASVSQMWLGNEVFDEAAAKQGRKFYTYVFGPTIPGDDAGAFHSSDLWFEFETLMKCWRPFDGHHFDLARKMCNYWTNFAKTGDPNGNDKDGTPMPVWTPYTTENPCSMRFYDEVYMDEGPSERDRYLIKINSK
jgi:para-nitrobenzyl esterase